uniref:Reverse transcriptase domain-containing protein n=1 Tax=Tanacetum cinerariifolium TaxID=118510 RepID=A0A699HQF8_TANCI|nr:reverse transcriptase domain-containing protein [Tanacetum cinerariifolium]
MHTRASNFELVEPLPKPERTLNQRLHQRNGRVSFDQRNNPPQHPRIVYSPILNIIYFRHFLDILRNYDPMDDDPMWAADRVVALTLDSAITISETANQFAIKADEGSSNSDTDKNMARMDAMTIKMDAQYKELQSKAKQPTPDLDDDDMPMSREEEAKFMQTFLIRVKQKQLNLRVRTERMVFNIESAMKHSYSNDDTCFSVDEILEEDFDALNSIEGTLLEEEIFSEFDEFMVMAAEENSKSKSDSKEPPFEKITINTDYKIKTSLKEPPMDLELKPLHNNLEYVFLEEPSFLIVIISSQLSAQNKSKLVSVLKNIMKSLHGKRQTFLVSVHHSANTRYNFWMTRN